MVDLDVTVQGQFDLIRVTMPNSISIYSAPNNDTQKEKRDDCNNNATKSMFTHRFTTSPPSHPAAERAQSPLKGPARPASWQKRLFLGDS